MGRSGRVYRGGEGGGSVITSQSKLCGPIHLQCEGFEPGNHRCNSFEVEDYATMATDLCVALEYVSKVKRIIAILWVRMRAMPFRLWQDKAKRLVV